MVASQRTDISAALAQFAAHLSFEDIPATTLKVCKAMMLDAYGCALAASSIGDGCKPVINVMRSMGGPAEATIIGTLSRVAAQNAAFANGALVHALNYDSYDEEIGHVGVVCLVAPLALAEAIQASGRSLLLSAVIACEVSARITAAIVRTGRHPSERFLAGQLLSYSGATAGAARILGLDAVGIQNALGLALMQTAGSRQIVLGGEPSAKAIYGAFPNQAAVLSARLAAAGLDAACDTLGDPAGLYSMVYDGRYDAAALTEGLGSTFMMEQSGFKPWPASALVHSFIEAALIARGSIADVDAIKSIEVTTTSHYRPRCEPREMRNRPANAAVAANSIPYCIARVLSHGSLGLSDMNEEALQNIKTVNLAENIHCRFDALPSQARLTISLHDGGSVVQEIDYSTVYPMAEVSSRQLHEKFSDCCAQLDHPLSGAEVGRIIQFFDDLEQIDNVNELHRPPNRI